MRHTVMILDPGHFHAALPLRTMNPRLTSDVHVFASDGPDLERFLALVNNFNSRAKDPTSWTITVHRSADPLATLLKKRPGDVAILAGRNAGKLARIAALVEAGIHVLADKPWVVESTDIQHLHRIVHQKAHCADLMTERCEPFAMLFADLTRQTAIVGQADTSRGPTLVKETIHHLAKIVNGTPLIRPAWYFDVAQQGEGLIDVTTHYVDQALLIAGADKQPIMAGEVMLLDAKRWTTAVSAADFTTITGTPAFPQALLQAVRDGVLHLAANGEIDFICRGLTARVRAEWRLRAADDAGDRHCARYHGTSADLELNGTGSSGSQFRVRPHAGHASAMRTSLIAWAATRPGITLIEEADAIVIRPGETSGHEAHFAAQLDSFLSHVDHGSQPAWERHLLTARYQLLAEARQRATE